MDFPHEKLDILLIDDDELDRRRIKRFLSTASHISEAWDGESARDVLASDNRPDLVVMDYNMPSTNTVDLLDDFVAAGVPVIMLTGEGNESVAVNAMKHGAKDYLVKDDLNDEVLKKSLSSVLERTRLERELQEKQQELQDFAHGAAHDLMAPFARIKMCIEMLQEELEDVDESSERMLKAIESSCDHSMDLISSLIEYARTGRSNRPKENVNLAELTNKVIENLEAKINELDATVTVDELPEVWGDPVALGQLLQNLISNAVKFKGEQPPVIEISSEKVEGATRVRVKDNGVGIAQEDQPKVFKAFQRVYSKDKYEGSGIGLALCKKIIDQHNGRIWIQSELGEGCTFIFDLPDLSETS